MIDPVEIPIEDHIDLHTFLPKDVPELLRDYLLACSQKGIFTVRIIHGKGTGTLKKTVEACLAKNPVVLHFSAAPVHAGGWGATIAELKRDHHAD